MRITVKALGDFSGKIRRVRPGTRVVAEGPFGAFTESARRREKVVLIAGGIGITPIRALLEEMNGDVIVLYRVLHDDDIIFRGELEDPAILRRELQDPAVLRGELEDPRVLSCQFESPGVFRREHSLVS